MKIKSTNFGIAYRYGNTIELNPILNKYPKYKKEVLKHEMEHKPNTKMDFWHDFKAMFNSSKEGTKFFLENPIPCLQSLAPVWFDNGMQYNNFMIAMWSGLILIVGLGVMI